jgi:aryl-alcohol dehydrogenase-like predicted oxidoreductase
MTLELAVLRKSAMNPLSRRHFSTLVAATPLATGTVRPMPRRTLGKIGFSASILGLGAQRLADRGPMEQSEVNRIIGEAIEQGLNYIDTARGYGESERLLGPALAGKRDKVFLVTKTRSGTREGALADLRESLKLLKTDYVDCVHIHNIARDDRFPDLDFALSDKGVLGGLMEAKRLGMTKHIGCTAHLKPSRVLPVFATGQIELFMASLNFVERHIYNFEERVLPEARRRGIGVVAMKVLGGPGKGGGALLGEPANYEATLRYVWSLKEVDVAIVGMRSLEELRSAMALAKSFRPLSKQESAALMARGKELAGVWGELRGPAA